MSSAALEEWCNGEASASSGGSDLSNDDATPSAGEESSAAISAIVAQRTIRKFKRPAAAAHMELQPLSEAELRARSEKIFAANAETMKEKANTLRSAENEAEEMEDLRLALLQRSLMDRLAEEEAAALERQQRSLMARRAKEEEAAAAARRQQQLEARDKIVSWAVATLAALNEEEAGGEVRISIRNSSRMTPVLRLLLTVSCLLDSRWAGERDAGGHRAR